LRKLFNKNGFTLVEVIVTLAIISIVIGPLMAMLITSQKINNESEKEYKSLQYAQQYLEEIKAMDSIETSNYTQTLTTADGYKIDIVVSPSSVAEDVGEVTYDATMTINAEGNIIWKDNFLTDTIHMVDGMVDLTIDTDIGKSKIFIEKAEPKVLTAVASPKINIILYADTIINVLNCDGNVEFYLNDDDKKYNWNINVINGIAPIIHSIEMKTALDILYDIKISVTKDGITKTTTGTTILKRE